MKTTKASTTPTTTIRKKMNQNQIKNHKHPSHPAPTLTPPKAEAEKKKISPPTLFKIKNPPIKSNPLNLNQNKYKKLAKRNKKASLN